MTRRDHHHDEAPLDDDADFAARMATARRAQQGGSPSSRPESAIVAEILEWLNGQPHTLARKVHQTLVTGGGEPDIDGCIRGRSIKIEVKRPDAPPPPVRQLQRLRAWQRAGALVAWVTSLDQVIELVGYADDHSFVNPLSGPGVPPR